MTQKQIRLIYKKPQGFSATDELVQRARIQAAYEGISRSELIAKAVEEYLDKHESYSQRAKRNLQNKLPGGGY